MSKKYNHLSLVQRYQIEILWMIDCPQKLIAQLVGVHPSTICRELKRNVGRAGQHAGVYHAFNAERRAQDRHRQKPKHIRLDLAMKRKILALLSVPKWSPECISGWIKMQGDDMVSIERIYQWIWYCKYSNRAEDREFKNAYKLLKHGHRRQKRGNLKPNRQVIPNRVGIEQRPGLISKRERPGDMEADLMIGKDHKSALLVITDRFSLQTYLHKLKSKNSEEVTSAIINKLKKCPYKLHTITFDNDRCFSGHELVAEELKVQTYFTRPYTSQDKGTVENRIGTIRRFYPKKTDLRNVSEKEIKEVETLLNQRPVRKFNYKTSNQVLQQKIALAG